MNSPVVTVNQIAELRARLRAQSKSYDISRVIWLVTLVPPLVLMIGIALQPWVSPGDLLRDPLAVAEMSETCCKVYFGAVSSAGVLLWASGAAICVFAASVLAVSSRQIRQAIFLFSAGLLTGILVLDDLFLVHDNILPAFGVSQPAVYGTYALLCSAYILVSWRQILANRYGLLAVAIALFGASIKIDWLFHSDHPVRILLEDGAKLCGIFAWTSFHIIAAWQALTGRESAIR